MKLNLDLNGLKKVLKKVRMRKAKIVFVQLPEGLKTKIQEIKEALKGYNTYFSIEPVFGACDLQEHLANKLNADVIIHFGHTEFVNFNKPKVIYWPTYYVFDEFEMGNVVRTVEKIFDGKRVSFIYPSQYSPAVEEIMKKLKKEKKVVLVEGKPNNRIKTHGQVLGCDVSGVLPILDDIDYVLYVGDGYFHPSAAFNIPFNKKIYWVMPNKEITEIKAKEEEIKRKEMIPFIIKEKNVFGIFVTRKTGQFDMKIAERVREILEKNNKDVIMLVGDNLEHTKLLGLKIEVLVNTACPRISDDYKNYAMVVANPKDVFDAFEKKIDIKLPLV